MLDQTSAPGAGAGAPAALTIDVTATEAATIVTIRGELDLMVGDRLRSRLAEVTALAPRALVLDLTRVTFCGARGLAALLVAASEADVSEVSFGIVAEHRAVTRPVELLGLGRVLPIHRSIADALDRPATVSRLRTALP